MNVTLRLDNETTVRLSPGAVIGRSSMAALRIDDPAISEAHALVSFRGSGFRLLSLRGRFAIAGKLLSDMLLAPGLVIELAPRVVLEVVAVTLPARVPALRIDGLGDIVPPPVASLFAVRAQPSAGLSPEADAILWTNDGVMRLRRAGQADRTLEIGDGFTIEHRSYRVVALPLADAAILSTETNARHAPPLLMVVRYDTVHLWRGEVGTLIDGLPARVLSELALMGVPAEWRHVAKEIWPEEADDRRLRMNWDAALARLRQRLREAGVRSDLVRSAGVGLVELVLGPDDRVTDAT